MTEKKNSSLWQALFKSKEGNYVIGLFTTCSEAARAYDFIAKEVSMKRINHPYMYPQHHYIQGQHSEVEIDAAKKLIKKIPRHVLTESSLYNGVVWQSFNQSWVAYFKFHEGGNFRHFICEADTEVKAAKAYDHIAKEVNNVKLNFPEDYPDHSYVENAQDVPLQVEQALRIISEYGTDNVNTKTGMYGVSLVTQNDINTELWRAEVKIQGNIHVIGYYKRKVEAAYAYDRVAKEMSNRPLNYPREYPAHEFISGGFATDKEIDTAIRTIKDYYKYFKLPYPMSPSMRRDLVLNRPIGSTYQDRIHVDRFYFGGSSLQLCFSIVLEKKLYHIGTFKNLEDAIKAYDDIAQYLSNRPLNNPEKYPDHPFIEQGPDIPSEIEIVKNIFEPRSKYGIGVEKNNSDGRYHAKIFVNGSLLDIASFIYPTRAARAYDLVARQLNHKQLNSSDSYIYPYPGPNPSTPYQLADVNRALRMIETVNGDWFMGVASYQRGLPSGQQKFRPEIQIKDTIYRLEPRSNVVEAAKEYDKIASLVSCFQLNFPDDYPDHVYREGSGASKEEEKILINTLEICLPKKNIKYMGISYSLEIGKFLADIHFDNYRVYLGAYNSSEEAARAYDNIACELSYLKLNFPEEHPNHKYCLKSFTCQELEYKLADKKLRNLKACRSEPPSDFKFVHGYTKEYGAPKKVLPVLPPTPIIPLPLVPLSPSTSPTFSSSASSSSSSSFTATTTSSSSSSSSSSSLFSSFFCW